MIVTLGSIRGAPGVTSWSLLLAAAWPAEFDVECVVLEADVDGGVLGARYGLGVDPGAVSLTAALRRTHDHVPVEAHGRLLPCGLWVVPGPENAEQAAGLWDESAQAVADRLVADDRVWLVDAGRLTKSSPALAFAARSQFTVLVSRAEPEHLVAIPSRAAALHTTCGERLGVLVVGRVSHPLDELREFLGVSEVWTVGAEIDIRATTGGVLSGRARARRAVAWREALSTAARLAALTVAPAARERAGELR